MAPFSSAIALKLSFTTRVTVATIHSPATMITGTTKSFFKYLPFYILYLLLSSSSDNLHKLKKTA
jgi:hypothetical protein